MTTGQIILFLAGAICLCVWGYKTLVSYRQDSGDIHEVRAGLLGKISIWMGRWGARKETTASLARTEAAEQLNLETTARIQLAEQETIIDDLDYAKSLKPEMREMELEGLRKNHIVQMATAENKLLLAQAANEKVLTVDAYIKEREREFQDRADIEKEMLLLQARIRAGIVAKNLPVQQQIHLLTEELKGLYREVYLIKTGNDSEEVRGRIVGTLESRIATLEENLNGTQQRLLQSHHGTEGGGASKGHSDVQPDLR